MESEIFRYPKERDGEPAGEKKLDVKQFMSEFMDSKSNDDLVEQAYESVNKFVPVHYVYMELLALRSFLDYNLVSLDGTKFSETTTNLLQRLFDDERIILPVKP